MKQEQSIGNSNQHQTLPNRNKPEQTKEDRPENLKPAPVHPEKPAVTDDFGNVVNRKNENSGKGYNESKPTDPGGKAKGEETEQPENTKNQHEFPEQEKWESREAYEKRIQQSEDVAG